MTESYSEEQLQAYLKSVGLPEKDYNFKVSKDDPEGALKFLARLQKYQLAAVPFDNLSIHFSQHHTISLDPLVLYRKLVETKGRGGYCMENNKFFGMMLQALGYELYPAGARVAAGAPTFGGWSHMINIVTIGGKKYSVDVGFGGQGAVQPVPLQDGVVLENMKPASIRLQYTNIDQNQDPNQKLWVFQQRKNDASEFQNMYCFTELEFLSRDYEIMSYYTSTSTKSWFTQRAVCMKFLMNDNEEIYGQLILQNDMKRRTWGETEHLSTFRTEKDRIAALKEYFSIDLDPTEAGGIVGMVSEIK